MECGDCVFEFMGQSGRHFAEAFQVLLERQLLAQLCDLGDIGQQAKRAPLTLIRREIYRRYRGPNSSRQHFRIQRFNFFSTIDLPVLQTLFHHLCKLGDVLKDNGDGLAQVSAVGLEQCASRTVYNH